LSESKSVLTELEVIAKGERFNIMYSLGLLIVELQTARRRLLHVFEVADGTPTSGLRTHLQQCEKVGRWRGTTDVETKGTLALYCERWSVC
jgi:hypothetical protein